MSHRSSWGAPRWPATPPIARTRPGTAVARLGFDTGCLIDRRGGPRYGPPASSSEGGYAPPRTPPAIARTRPGTAVARLGLDTGCLIDRRGGPRYGPPASSSEAGYAPLGLPRPSLGRAPAQPWRASGLTQDVSSIVVGGPEMAPQIL